MLQHATSYSLYLLLVCTINIDLAFGSNQHLICKTVENVFTDGSTHTSNTPERLHGPPGKRGQTGVKGEPGIPGLKGERGLPGFVAPQSIENVVAQKVNEANRELLARVEKLEVLVAKLNSSKSDSDIPEDISCDEGFVYKRKCYFSILDRVNFEKGRSLCVSKGGKLANILNREQEDLVVGYVRNLTSRQVELWLGMSYTPSTSTSRWSDGSKVPDAISAAMRWWSGYPDPGLKYQRLIFVVGPSTVGFLNYFPSYSINGGMLCEK